MEKRTYQRLDECVYWDKLPNGLTVAVVPRKGFSKKMAYFVTGAGSMHRRFTMDGKDYRAPMGVAHYLEHKLFEDEDGDILEGAQKFVDAENAQQWKKFLRPCLAMPERVLDFYSALPEVEGNKVTIDGEQVSFSANTIDELYEVEHLHTQNDSLESLSEVSAT